MGTEDDDISRKLAEHILRRQIEPQEAVQDLRRQGVNVTTEFVSTNMEEPGFTVTCGKCGRTARLPFELPQGKVALCPDCIRSLQG